MLTGFILGLITGLCIGILAMGFIVFRAMDNSLPFL